MSNDPIKKSKMAAKFKMAAISPVNFMLLWTFNFLKRNYANLLSEKF